MYIRNAAMPGPSSPIRLHSWRDHGVARTRGGGRRYSFRSFPETPSTCADDDPELHKKLLRACIRYRALQMQPASTKCACERERSAQIHVILLPHRLRSSKPGRWSGKWMSPMGGASASQRIIRAPRHRALRRWTLRGDSSRRLIV
jgi:hypothetical protein